MAALKALRMYSENRQEVVMGRLDAIKAFYDSRIGKGLPDHMVLGWESMESQRKRFEVLISSIDLEGKEILDVGCGLGNLLEYLKEKGINARYTGVDINKKMVEHAKRKNENSKFLCADIFSSEVFQKEAFDVVFASGIFNINLGNNREFLEKGFVKLLELSRRYVVFNLLDVKSPAKEDRFFYFSPDEVTRMIINLPLKAGNIKVIEGYLNNDFTVICDKEGSADF